MSGREGLELALVDALAPVGFSSRGSHRGSHPSTGALEAAQSPAAPAPPGRLPPNPASTPSTPSLKSLGTPTAVNRKNSARRWKESVFCRGGRRRGFDDICAPPAPPTAM